MLCETVLSPYLEGIALDRRWTLFFNLALILWCLFSCLLKYFRLLGFRSTTPTLLLEPHAQGAYPVWVVVPFFSGGVTGAVHGGRNALVVSCQQYRLGEGCLPRTVRWESEGIKMAPASVAPAPARKREPIKMASASVPSRQTSFCSGSLLAVLVMIKWSSVREGSGLGSWSWWPGFT